MKGFLNGKPRILSLHEHIKNFVSEVKEQLDGLIVPLGSGSRSTQTAANLEEHGYLKNGLF